MGKPKRERTLADNEAQAVTRNLRVSPQKLNLVAALIRGKKVNTALAQKFEDWWVAPSTQKKIAGYTLKGKQLFFPNAGK